MKRSKIAVRVLLCATAAAFASGAYAAASGKVNYSGTAWDVADGLAFVDDDETIVVLGSVAFDRKAYAEDGKLDTFDFMMQDNLKTLKVKV